MIADTIRFKTWKRNKPRKTKDDNISGQANRGSGTPNILVPYSLVKFGITCLKRVRPQCSLLLKVSKSCDSQQASRWLPARQKSKQREMPNLRSVYTKPCRQTCATRLLRLLLCYSCCKRSTGWFNHNQQTNCANAPFHSECCNS